MSDWLGENAWLVWASVGLVLAVAELVSLDLVLLMLAVGAFAGAASAALGAPAVVDVLVAAVVSTGMLALVRPPVIRRLHGGPELTTGHAALVGKDGVVTSTVGRNGGQVKLAGEVWSARAYDPGETLEVGTQVSVFEIDGATAVVYPNE